MVSYSTIVLLLIPIVAVTLLDFNSAFAQQAPQKYIIARIEIWALFYRLMVVAFVIGAVVMGTVAYVTWRFRESHPKNRESIPPTRSEGGARH
jgi:heme/copper-type cytochrome/quinol oxidase subunit 2